MVISRKYATRKYPSAEILSPTIEGLVGWFDVYDSAIASNTAGRIAQWNNLVSGGTHATQATENDKPTFLGDSIYGEGFAKNFGISIPINTQSFSIFVVARTHDVPIQRHQGVFVSDAVATSKGIFQTLAGNLQFFNSVAPINSGLSTDNGTSYQIFGISSSATELKFFVGNNTFASAAIPSQTITLSQLLNFNSGAFSFRGHTRSILIYNTPQGLDGITKGYLENRLPYRRITGYTSPTTRRVLFDGDSMTRGFGLASSVNTMPSQVLALLGATWHGNNFGVDSQTLANMAVDASQQIVLMRDSSLAKDVAVVWGGTNDIYFGATGATTYTRLQTVCNTYKNAGFRVVVASCLPRSNTGTPAGFETERTSFNTSLRSAFNVAAGTNVFLPAAGTTFADALADIAANTLIGDAGDEVNATYYPDRVHMNTAGYSIIAAIVKDAILAV